jgi:hypothetical protein
MLYAYKYKHRRYHVILVFLSCILLFTHLALSEYFIGLELLRPLLIGLAFSQITNLSFRSAWQTWFKEIFLEWLPYLAALIAYLTFRLVLFRSGRLATDSTTIIQQILANPLVEISHRLASILTDPVDVVILAWVQPLYKFVANYMISPRIWWGCMGIFAAATLLSWFFFSHLQRPIEDTDYSHQKRMFEPLGLGLIAVLFAGIPLWGINREVFLGGLGDRYSFPFIFGSAVVLASGITLIAKKAKTRFGIASLLIGLSVGFHVWNTTVVYSADWLNQQKFLAQLNWRAPGLEQGTSIWVVKDPTLLAMEGDYGLAMPVNWIYETEQHSANVNLWVFPLTDEFLGRTGIFQFGPENSIQRPIRNVTFTGNPNQTMVAWFAPPNCLKIIDPNQTELVNALPIPSTAKLLAHVDPIISKPAQAQQLPANIFGIQEKDWCYYFEQADLARQITDWQTVASLGDSAAQKGFKPSNDSEWLPFIEAYVQLGRYDDATKLINIVQSGEFSTSKTLICGFVERIANKNQAVNNPAILDFLRNISQKSTCPITTQ